jgi:hypothetical protein
MGVVRLDTDAVAVETAEALGLDPSIDLMSAEGLAASIRRAASFACPTTPGVLARTMSEVLSGLRGFGAETPDEIAHLIESMVAYGDLLELPLEDSQGTRRRLFLGPPAYVRRRGTNSCLLLGIRPEGAALLSDGLAPQIEYVRHARVVRLAESEPLTELMDDEGVVELQPEQWLRSPRATSARDLIAFYTDRLHALGQSGELDLRIIDPSSSVTYYRARWRTLMSGDNGYFVARRPQAWGADLWCFTQIVQGQVAKIIDLPLQSSLAPGADEAWRLQAAIDVLASNPQRVRVSEGEEGLRRVGFFSPVPSWMQRRLDIIGVPCPGGRGALFAYELPREEVQEELDFLAERMWISIDEATTAGDDR